jgi:hypothetical protein
MLGCNLEVAGYMVSAEGIEIFSGALSDEEIVAYARGEEDLLDFGDPAQPIEQRDLSGIILNEVRAG